MFAENVNNYLEASNTKMFYEIYAEETETY